MLCQRTWDLKGPMYSDSQAAPGSILTITARTISSRNPKFTGQVLPLREILINDIKSIVPSTCTHFGTAESQDGCDIEYDKLDGLGGANVWLLMDQVAIDAVPAECNEMRGLGLCEQELRSVRISEDRRWRADRILQLVCPPKENAH
jgi:hypothetical protein